MKTGGAGWKTAGQVLSCCFVGPVLTTSVLLQMDIYLLNRNHYRIMESQLSNPSREGNFTIALGSL